MANEKKVIREIANIAKEGYKKKDKIVIAEKTRQSLVRRQDAIKQLQGEIQSILQTILEMNEIGENDMYNTAPDFSILTLHKDPEKSKEEESKK